jgi:hypothetical protein
MKDFTVLYGIRTNAEGRPNGATGLRRDREDNDVVVRADRGFQRCMASTALINI